MKENIKVAMANGLLNKDVALFALLDLVSEDQLAKSPIFSLSYPKSKLKSKIKAWFPSAVFSYGRDPSFIPAKCEKGRWYQYNFSHTFRQPFTFFTKDLRAWNSSELRALMKSIGCRSIYCNPCVNGKFHRITRSMRFSHL